MASLKKYNEMFSKQKMIACNDFHMDVFYESEPHTVSCGFKAMTFQLELLNRASVLYAT